MLRGWEAGAGQEAGRGGGDHTQLQTEGMVCSDGCDDRGGAERAVIVAVRIAHRLRRLRFAAPLSRPHSSVQHSVQWRMHTAITARTARAVNVHNARMSLRRWLWLALQPMIDRPHRLARLDDDVPQPRHPRQCVDLRADATSEEQAVPDMSHGV